ncbi:MAG TPA: 4'-phosphopantetheinyl transferase superfamily protein [Verrucomicrobiales bacterium]|jgi:4'-phosphopantetheinyl transferase|nr:4'-phosphopantetheinyl transferase superfamily protein [Verrucomicrobiales bacterium]
MITLPPPVFSTRWRDADISVFAADFSSPLTPAMAASVLSAEEMERAERFHFPDDRERWIRSRALLRLSLADRLNATAASLTFQLSTRGKPRLPGHPGCHFNLSHSGDMVAVAIRPGPVGIDIERRRDNLPVVSLAAHAFLPDEAAAIRTAAHPHALFYQLWTAKEAVMKCTGLGMCLPPGEISVSSQNGAPSLATCSGGGSFSVLSLPVANNYSLAVAVLTGSTAPAHLHVSVPA